MDGGLSAPFAVTGEGKMNVMKKEKNTPPGFNYNCCGGLPGFDNGVVIGLYGNKKLKKYIDKSISIHYNNLRCLREQQ